MNNRQRQRPVAQLFSDDMYRRKPRQRERKNKRLHVAQLSKHHKKESNTVIERAAG